MFGTTDEGSRPETPLLHMLLLLFSLFQNFVY